MYRILFVDDEPNIIQALQRMLRPMRSEWEMTMVASGEEALDLLAQHAFDVVVTDMRMPRINGAELLMQVRSQFPDVARIVLSGQAERETVLALAGVMHMYLAKPCDTQTLKNAVVRTCALRDLLRDRGLRGVVTGLQSLPSLPSIYWELMQAIQEDRASLSTISEIVSRDMGMSAAVLHVVNSAWFGLPRQISNIAGAISFLGIDNLRSLFLTTHVFSQVSDDRIHRLSLEGLWEFSTRLAAYSLKIARFEKFDVREIDNASMAGFLHGVGTLVLAHNLPERYLAAQVLSRKKRIPMWQAEIETFGASHSDVAAYLLSLWGLPVGVVDPVAWCHRPSLYPVDMLSTVAVVHVASAFANASLHTVASELDADIDNEMILKLHLSEKIKVWKNLCECDAFVLPRAA